MKEYRKRDVISNEDIKAFETIEINKIKSKIITKEKPWVFRMKWKLILPVLAIAFIASIALNNEEKVNPLLNDIKLAEINTISVRDLPLSLQGLEQKSIARVTFLGSFTTLSNSLVFEEEEDVTGEAQLTLTELIAEQENQNDAEDMFHDLYENLLYLELDTVSSFDELNEYYFIVNTDGTYVLTLKTFEDEATNIIELSTYYEEDELFYQVRLETTKDEQSSIFQIKYNEDNTKKYQYAKIEESDEIKEYYIYLEKDNLLTKVGAIGKTNDEVYTVVADANDLQGVIFSSYITEDLSITSTEYYDGNGALLKQEEGVDTLTIYNGYLDELFLSLEEDHDADMKNLSDIISGFTQPDEFLVKISLNDSVLAKIQDVPATLVLGEAEYAINYSFDDFLYSKKEEDFTSGDTLYHITNYETTETDVILTLSALYDVPEKVMGPNGLEYYINNKYMAKYIEAKDGFTIVQNESGKYQLVNDSIEGEIGDRIDIDITTSNYYIDGELSETIIFQHTSAIQFENLEFTKLDTINGIKTNMFDLYNQLIPSNDELDEYSESIDVSFFE